MPYAYNVICNYLYFFYLMSGETQTKNLQIAENFSSEISYDLKLDQLLHFCQLQSRIWNWFVNNQVNLNFPTFFFYKKNRRAYLCKKLFEKRSLVHFRLLTSYKGFKVAKLSDSAFYANFTLTQMIPINYTKYYTNIQQIKIVNIQCKNFQTNSELVRSSVHRSVAENCNDIPQSTPLCALLFHKAYLSNYYSNLLLAYYWECWFVCHLQRQTNFKKFKPQNFLLQIKQIHAINKSTRVNFKSHAHTSAKSLISLNLVFL